MNVLLLKSKMVLFGDENFTKSIASILEVTRQTAAAKLNGESEFTHGVKARYVYGLSCYDEGVFGHSANKPDGVDTFEW